MLENVVIGNVAGEQIRPVPGNVRRSGIGRTEALKYGGRNANMPVDFSGVGIYGEQAVLTGLSPNILSFLYTRQL